MLIIDRFEGEYAVIEDGKTTFNVLKKNLPNNAKVGDVVVSIEENKFVIDEKITSERKKNIERIALDLWKD